MSDPVHPLPASPDKVFDHGARLARAVRIGVFISIAWLVGFVVIWKTNLLGLADLGAAELGGLLSGFFAPLALVWFIVALTHQAAELAQNTDALRLQVREMKEAVQEASRQAGALEGNLKLSQLDILYRTIEQDLDLLSTTVASFLSAIQILGGTHAERTWNEYSAGNRDALFNYALANLPDSTVNWDMQLRSKAQTNASLLHSYLRGFDAFARSVAQLDQVGIYRLHFQDGAARRLRERAEQWLREMGHST